MNCWQYSKKYPQQPYTVRPSRSGRLILLTSIFPSSLNYSMIIEDIINIIVGRGSAQTFIILKYTLILREVLVLIC